MGVDISTAKVTLAVTDGKHAMEVVEVAAQGKRALDRFPTLCLAFDALLRKYKPDVVYVEGLPFVKSRDGIVSFAAVLGAVRTLCVVRRTRCVVVPGYQWKKVLGTGTKKEQIAEWVANTGHVFETQDMCDAYAIAEYGYLMETK